MNSCRLFPSSASTWKPLVQRAIASCSDGAVLSPPHFQAYCIDPKTDQVKDNMNYSSMLSANSMPSATRQSGVLVLLEPVSFVSSSSSSKGNNNGSSRLPLLSSELRTYVTRRTSHLRTHKGEVSYPGGKCDGSETPQQAAVREGMEEIGADPSKYEILGQLSRVYSFPSRSFVVPTVAIAKEGCVVEVDVHDRTCNKEEHEDDDDDTQKNPVEWKPDGSHLKISDETTNCHSKPRQLHKSIQASSLNLEITSACEVDSIESMNLCELLLSTEHHHFIEREWKAPSAAPGEPEKEKMRWMLPAFYTNEEHSMLWGLTGFVFCELLSRLAHVLQQEQQQGINSTLISSSSSSFPAILTDSELTEFERDARKKLLTFCERSSKHYLERMDEVVGLPRANHAVKFCNPYDDIPLKK